MKSLPLYNGPFSHPYHSKGLVIDYRGGGGLQNRKIAGPKHFAHSRQSKLIRGYVGVRILKYANFQTFQIDYLSTFLTSGKLRVRNILPT